MAYIYFGRTDGSRCCQESCSQSVCPLVLKLCVNPLFLFFLSVSEVDECQISPYICGQGICYNTAEGYTCHCDEGYRLDEAQNTCVGERSAERRVLLKSSTICSFSVQALLETKTKLCVQRALALEAQTSVQIEFCKID